MALSLSGDDEEYDSESEQVRPLISLYARPTYVCVRSAKRVACEKKLCVD